MYGDDDGWDGFEWIDPDDRDENVVAYKRRYNGEEIIIVVNFSGVDINYRFGVDKGKYEVVFNSDKKSYGGKGISRKRVYESQKISSKGKKDSIIVTLADRSFLYLVKK